MEIKTSFISYDELCSYCSCKDFFQRKISHREIVAILDATEKFFPIRLNELAKQYGFDEVTCSITYARKALGRCSYSERHISLNIVLLCYPKIMREGVFIHELCHLTHNNHSKAFYELLYSMVDRNYKVGHYENSNYVLRDKLIRCYNKCNGSRKVIFKS